MDQQLLEKMIREVMISMSNGGVSETTSLSTSTTGPKVGLEMYPLSKNITSRVKSSTGKSLDEFTIENVMSGKIGANDCRISPETLEMQAQVAESINREAFAKNLRRAAELISIPDDRILEIYNSLRPFRSSKSELLDIATELETKYNAKINAELVREAAELYEKRSKLRMD